MPKIRIKVSKVDNLTNARYFAAMGVHYLGFCCNPGTEYHCTPARIREIASWVEGPQIVPEFEGYQEESEVRAILDSGIGDAVHLGILADYSGGFSVPVFRDFIFENISAGDLAGTDFPVLRTDRAVSSFTEGDWQKMAMLTQNAQIFLDAHFKPEDLPGLMEKLPLHGIILRGGKEEKTGFKSFDEMDRIFELLED